MFVTWKLNAEIFLECRYVKQYRVFEIVIREELW